MLFLRGRRNSLPRGCCRRDESHMMLYHYNTYMLFVFFIYYVYVNYANHSNVRYMLISVQVSDIQCRCSLECMMRAMDPYLFSWSVVITLHMYMTCEVPIHLDVYSMHFPRAEETFTS